MEMSFSRKLLAASLFAYIASLLFARPMAFILETEMDVKEFVVSTVIYVSPWAYYWWTSREKENIAENVFSVSAILLSVLSYYSISTAFADVKAFAIVIQILLLYVAFIGALFIEIVIKIFTAKK